jgi:hypothetical protein
MVRQFSHRPDVIGLTGARGDAETLIQVFPTHDRKAEREDMTDVLVSILCINDDESINSEGRGCRAGFRRKQDE